MTFVKKKTEFGEADRYHDFLVINLLSVTQNWQWEKDSCLNWSMLKSSSVLFEWCYFLSTMKSNSKILYRYVNSECENYAVEIWSSFSTMNSSYRMIWLSFFVVQCFQWTGCSIGDSFPSYQSCVKKCHSDYCRKRESGLLIFALHLFRSIEIVNFQLASIHLLD